MLWRVRLTLPDRPGALATLASECGAAGVNILGLQVFPGIDSVTDELVLEVPDGWDVDDIAALVERAGAHGGGLAPLHGGGAGRPAGAVRRGGADDPGPARPLPRGGGPALRRGGRARSRTGVDHDSMEMTVSDVSVQVHRARAVHRHRARARRRPGRAGQRRPGPQPRRDGDARARSPAGHRGDPRVRRVEPWGLGAGGRHDGGPRGARRDGRARVAPPAPGGGPGLAPARHRLAAAAGGGPGGRGARRRRAGAGHRAPTTRRSCRWCWARACAAGSGCPGTA